jgi:hypothetical protein
MFCRPEAESVSSCCPINGLQELTVAPAFNFTQASIVHAALLAVGMTGSPELFKNANPPLVEFLFHAMSSIGV